MSDTETTHPERFLKLQSSIKKALDCIEQEAKAIAIDFVSVATLMPDGNFLTVLPDVQFDRCENGIFGAAAQDDISYQFTYACVGDFRSVTLEAVVDGTITIDKKAALMGESPGEISLISKFSR